MSTHQNKRLMAMGWGMTPDGATGVVQPLVDSPGGFGRMVFVLSYRLYRAILPTT